MSICLNFIALRMFKKTALVYSVPKYMSIKHILTIKQKFLYKIVLQPAATFLYYANTIETSQLFNRQ
jgi:hypothetical protein